MALFTLGDLHLSFSADKPMDVFRGWDNYQSRIEKNWRAIVSDDDTVVIAGDLSWEMKIENMVDDFAFIHSLPGKKLIIKGNHDLWWTTVSKMKRFLSSWGFDSIDFINNNAFRAGDWSVCGSRGWMIEESGTDSKLISREALRLETSIVQAEKLGGEPVVFLHYPVIYEQSVCTELLDVLVRHNIRRVYYGHLHGQSVLHAFTGEHSGVSFKLISADAVKFTPVLVR